MNHRLKFVLLLFVASAMQAYFVTIGTVMLGTISILSLPDRWMLRNSARHSTVVAPFLAALAIPAVTAIFSWVLLGLRRKIGWSLGVAVDGFFLIPFVLYFAELARRREFRHPSDLLPIALPVVMLALHFFVLMRPQIRGIFLSRLTDSNLTTV